MRGIKVNNSSWACNTDGIDIDSCRNVTVSDCIIETGDDAIALRGCSGRLNDKTRICEHIVVTNCVVGSSSSVFRIGVGDGEIRNALFSNIVITRGGIGIHFNPAYRPPSKGVSISHVRFRDVSARNVAYPLVVEAGHAEATARIENIVVEGMQCEAFAPIRICGNARNKCHNIVLRNMEITVVPNPVKLDSLNDYPSTLIQIERADEVTLDRVRVQWGTSEPNWQHVIHAVDVSNLDIADNCHLPEP